MRETLNDRIAATGAALTEHLAGEWTPRLLESSPDGRAVVEWVQGARVLVAKLRTDGEGERQHALLAALSAIGAPTLRVPTPVAWLAGPRALVMARVPGSPCRTLDPGDPASAPVLERIGRALAELHASNVVPGPVKSMADHVADLMRPAPAELARALPAQAERIRAALERLQRESAAWGATPVVALHRDYQLRQLFDDGTHIHVLDWDDAASGDPAFDVGYLTAYLRSHHAEAAAERGIAAFLNGYRPDDALASRVPTYERFNALRRACRRFRLRDDGWEQELDRMLARLDN
ncbi:MAG: aminoglycoside phosphotransferase family protein [bacterium]